MAVVHVVRADDVAKIFNESTATALPVQLPRTRILFGWRL